MLTDDFDYPLPPQLIAQRPLPRGDSRLLSLPRAGGPEHRRVADLPALLRPGDLLVVNDTRVIPARLFAHRATSDGIGGRIEVFLLEKTKDREWEALTRPARKARRGGKLHIAPGLYAEVMAEGDNGHRRLLFSEEIEPHLERLGHVPLPPYIKRGDDDADRDSYQTVYARHPGAVAAPTAGLHFSDTLLAELAARGISRTAVTLHVGLGTFRPVTAERVEDHPMEEERYVVSPAAATAIRQARTRGGRIVAVGTTVVRTLESIAAGSTEVSAGAGRTRLFITPGFRFRVVDVLLTNFHLPRSTLLMLVSAFVGRERLLDAYARAIADGYRFYSYGDAMLAERAGDR